MALRGRRVKRFFSRTLPILAALVLLLSALYLVSDVQQGSDRFSQVYLWVLILAGLALLLMIVSIAQRLLQLLRRVRAEAPGARLSARMVRNFLILAIPPALIVYLFSLEFLDETIESWFDVRIESALEDSITLGQQVLGQRTLQVRNQLLRTSEDLAAVPDDQLVRQLFRRVSSAGPTELAVLRNTGQVIAVASIDSNRPESSRPSDFALRQALERGEFADAEPAANNSIQIRVLEALARAQAGRSRRILQALYPMPAEFSHLAANIQNEYDRYQQVAFLRNSLKQSFILILSLVLLITVLLAILAAINAARRMVNPISQLAEATEAVAKGNFERQIAAQHKDELGFLMRSFNLMTKELKRASTEAEISREEVETQRAHLETVLGRLSAGVMVFDRQRCLLTCNESAAKILGAPVTEYIEHSISNIEHHYRFLRPLLQRVSRELEGRGQQWRQEIKLDRGGSPLVLMCRGSRLPDGANQRGGHVVIFDDVTVLDQAQREAAWAEVARRLAHEVKNPLTPIRLSAERLQMKLLGQLNESDAAMLQRATDTIIAQVDAMKTMVNAFGDYAREPGLNRGELVLDELVRDVTELYQDPQNPDRIELKLNSGPQRIRADSGRLRQLLHNILQNAEDAIADQADGKIQVVTANADDDQVRLEVRDNGPGMPDEIAKRPFEPYLTTKPGGTGLGLAICRKIVEEHGGRIRLNNRQSGGTVATVWLPAG